MTMVRSAVLSWVLLPPRSAVASQAPARGREGPSEDWPFCWYWRPRAWILHDHLLQLAASGSGWGSPGPGAACCVRSCLGVFLAASAAAREPAAFQAAGCVVGSGPAWGAGSLSGRPGASWHATEPE